MTRAVNERMVKSFLDLFVLSLLDNGAKHGYEIMRELKTKTGAHIGAGTLYPLLPKVCSIAPVRMPRPKWHTGVLPFLFLTETPFVHRILAIFFARSTSTIVSFPHPPRVPRRSAIFWISP